MQSNQIQPQINVAPSTPQRFPASSIARPVYNVK